MIEVDGMISVAEAAKRLNRSIEQVRRYLREGKLKGQRIGNQWFIAETELHKRANSQRQLAFERARAVRERIREKYGEFDIAAEIQAARESRS